MVDSAKQGGRSLNPWVLHLQKLGLELKCPLCLSFLKRPFLLPCDHIFCSSCLPKAERLGAECPICSAQYGDQDLRHMSFIENMVSIYKSLDAAFSANKLQSTSSDNGRVLNKCHTLMVADCKNKLNKNPNSGQSGALVLDSSIDVAWKHGVADKCSVPTDIKDREYEIISSVDDRGSGERDENSPPSRGHKRGREGCGAVQIAMNQVDQLSPCSAPSFSGMKDSVNDSNDRGSDSPQNYVTVESDKENTIGKQRYEEHDGSASETLEGDLTDLKRHKKFNYGPIDMSTQSIGHVKPISSQTENLRASSSQSEKLAVPSKEVQSTAIVEKSVMKTLCGFCQSSKISEDTGPMLHFVNGKMIQDSDPFPSSAIHVHSVCIEWAPQVYYEGETCKNLKAELARGAKIKCSKCGLKGAALGCYLKSCRKSYHAPCATKISNCRWDCENFIMYCPKHSSLKFPHEKSVSKKQDFEDRPVSMPVVLEQSNFWAASSNGVKEWVFCGSALSTEDKFLLVKFGNKIGVPVTKFWRPTVTHVIAATDAKGACTRTLKVLMAILNGRWVLTIDWIKACMESMHPVDEEQYEINLDNHGCCDGPKTGRLSVVNNAPKLFDSLNFYFSGEFLSGYKEDLQNLVKAAGGTILASEEELMEQSHDVASPSRTLIVYNLDPPHGCKLGEEVSIIWKRANEAEDLAAKIGSQVIGHTWLLESISAYKLQPFVI